MRAVRWLLAGVLTLGVLVALPQTATRPAGAVTARPNVVVVMLDDMRWDELRFAPNVRRYISDRGLRFANAYSPLPLCCPARASFLLGQYAHNHRVYSHNAPYGFGALDDRRTIATSMRAAGYNTAMVGKYLNGYGRQRSLVTGGSSTLYKPAGWTDWMASLETSWPKGSGISGGTYNYKSFTQNVNRRVKMNRGKYSSNVIADQATALIEKYHRRTAPFFLWVTPVAPHHGAPFERRDPRNYRKANGFVQQVPTPFTPTWVRGKFNRVVTHAPGVPLRRQAEADLTDKPGYWARLLENTPTEKLRLRDVERQRAEAIYAWDAQFAKMIRALVRTGEYANTVLMFTSDNGYYLGEHRHPAGKIEHHEVSTRIPLVVAGPGVPRGTRYGPVTTPDLTATILDLANAPTLPGMDGTSVWPQVRGPDQGWTRPVLLEALIGVARTSPGFPPGVTEFGVHTGRYKFVRYSNGFEELYDLATDPNELTGRQRDPAYAEIKAQLMVLWEQYAACRGAACTAPLPPEFQLSPAQLRTQESYANWAKDVYYNR